MSTAPDAAAILSALGHRGPDGAGAATARSGDCTLYHSRLAVMDPLERSGQPMCSPDGRYWITYNGEVYNHAEIRRTLGSDIPWSTQSDTETVLRAYAAWGADCMPRLRGMFAFAVWDDVERSLFLARDPLGIKPLLYGRTPAGGLVFASELRALLCMNALPRTVDWVAAAEMIRQGAIRQPRTLIHHAKMLPGGHFARFESRQLRIVCYWDPRRFCHPGTSTSSYGAAVQQVRLAVEDATRAHAMSDVPIGAFLSGGIDSRLVVGTMQRLMPSPIKTFTIGFGARDERADARATASELGTDHHEQLVSEADWPALLEQFLDAIDQPSIDGFNTLAVSMLARPHVKVTLSGLGADELFAGYPHFGLFAGSSTVGRRLPRVIRQLLRARWIANRHWRLRELALMVQPPHSFLQHIRLGLDDSALRRELTLPDEAIAMARAETDAVVAACLSATGDPINQMSLYEVQSYLRDTLLRDVDVVSMRSGLEVRPVLLDTPLVELALSLPGDFKFRDGLNKAVLKDAFPDLLPPHVIRRPKRGFHVPAQEWTPRICVDLWTAVFESVNARALLRDEFRQGALAASSESRSARQDEWAAFVLLEVLRRQGLLT